MPEISIITSTYNRKKELKRCIRSILAQSYKDFELIVVDDCSDYNVKKLCQSFKDERIRFFKTDENFGHDGQPKNIGIREARGKYITFLDDDDEYRPDALKILRTYLVETGVDVVYGDYLNHLPGGKRSPGWSVDFNISRLLQHNYISMCVTMLKAEKLKAIGGFDEAVPKYKDWNCFLRLFKSGCDFLHIPIIVTEVHQMPGSVSERFLTEADENGVPKPTYFNPADCMLWPDKTILGERKPLRVAVYTLTNGRLKYLKRVADSLKRTAGYEFDWFVVENGSEDGTKEWLATQDCTFVTHNEALGVGRAWNEAVKLVRETDTYDLLVKCDDDAVFVTEGWLKTMVELFERSRRICLSPCVEGLEHSPGGVLRQAPGSQSPYVMVNDTILGTVPHLGGLVYATTADIWDNFRFDEESVGNKDVMLSNHARLSGHTLFYLEEARCLHETMKQKEDYPDRVI